MDYIKLICKNADDEEFVIKIDSGWFDCDQLENPETIVLEYIFAHYTYECAKKINKLNIFRCSKVVDIL
jgi:hypothetical protein